MLVRLVDREPDGVDAAHLTRPDPESLSALRDHDRVGGDVTHDGPGEEQLFPAFLVEVAAGDAHQVERIELDVAFLREHAADHALEIALAGGEGTALVVDEHAEVGAAGERFDRDRVEPGGEDHLEELLRERVAERGAHRSVEDDDAAVGRRRVGRQRLRVRALDRLVECHTAGVRVLDDHASRRFERRDEQPGGGEIVQVVVREGPALQLIDPGENVHARAALLVVRALLMRVLAVGDGVREVEDRQDRLGELLVTREPRGDRGVVRGCARERAGGQRAPRLEVDVTAGAQLLEHHVEVLGTTERNDEGVVLRGGAEHRRATDVDLLDCVGPLDVEPADGALEGVQVDVHEVDRHDPVLRDIGQVGVDVAPGEDATMDTGVERDDTVTEQLRHPRKLGDRCHGKVIVGDQLGRPTARDELDPEPVKLLSEGDDTRLVGRGEQGATDGHVATSSRTTSGRMRCSTAWMRACRVSTVSPGRIGTASWRRTGPVSTPSSTRCTVAPVTVAPAAKASSIA